MDQIQFLFFDLDGTLLDDEKKISEECIAYLLDLKQRRNVRFGFSTGRHEASVSPYLDTYQLRGLFDVMVCNSGSDIYYFDPPVLIKNNYLTPDTLNLIMDTFQDYDFLTVAFHNGHKLVTTKMNQEVQSVLTRNFYDTFYYPNQIAIQAAPKCLLLFDPNDVEKAKKAVESAPLEGLRGVFTEANICEFLCDCNSKASGVAKLLERYGLSLNDVMVFGDAENDGQIMESAGISVCMKNGDDDIKMIADYVTEQTNNENGIMDFLKKHEAWFRRKT